MVKHELDLISIIIPVYNSSKYINECILSLINQTYSNIEIIIVNDGSTDDSLEILNNLKEKDNRIVVISQQNSGVSVARNNGIENSSGKYITFVDSDDTVCEDYIEYLYKILKDNDADISLTRKPYKINSLSKPQSSDKMVQDIISVFSGLDAANEMLLYKIVISSWNKMYCRELIMEKNIRFNKELSFGEGFEFVINAFVNSKKVAVSNKKIYNYRVDNENSVMTRFSRKLVTGSIDSQKSIYDIIVNSPIDNDKKIFLFSSWKYSYWHTCCDCLNTIIGCNVVRENYDLYKFVKKNCRSLSFHSIFCDVPIKDKIKGIIYFVSPVFSSKMINKFRIRKFSKKDES